MNTFNYLLYSLYFYILYKIIYKIVIRLKLNQLLPHSKHTGKEIKNKKVQEAELKSKSTH